MKRFLKFLWYSIQGDNTYWIDRIRRSEPWTHYLTTRKHSIGKKLQRRLKERHVQNDSDTIYVFSVCRNASEKGDYRYNGGIKLLFNWIKCLIDNGKTAYFVTYQGSYHSWTSYEPPMISIEELKQIKAGGSKIVFVTSWLLADAFIELADQIYFYDCELAYTAGNHYHRLISGTHYHRLVKYIKNGKIRNISTHSRTQQAWYMTRFGFKPELIPIWIDGEAASIQPIVEGGELVLGYMNESDHAQEIVKHLQTLLAANEVPCRFIEVKGNEDACRQILKTCHIYLGLNEGKHPIFGEGSPLPQLEAMLQGATVVAFDVNGNREYLIDYFNGFVIPVGELSLMANRIIDTYRDKSRLNEMRINAVKIAENAKREDLKWNRLRQFLEIE